MDDVRPRLMTAVEVARVAAQVTNGTTSLAFDTVVRDELYAFSSDLPTRLQIRKRGLYLVQADAYWPSAAGNFVFELFIRLNGVSNLADHLDILSQATVGLNVAWLGILNSGDYLEARVQVGSASDFDAYGRLAIIGLPTDPVPIEGFGLPYVVEQLIIPGRLDLVLTTFAPTIRYDQIATPATLELVLTTFAPLLGVGTIVTPTTAELVIETEAFPPTVLQGKVFTPTTLALILTTYAPGVRTGNSKSPRVQRNPRADQRTRNGIDLMATIFNSLMDQNLLFLQPGELARGYWRLGFVASEAWGSSGPADMETALNTLAASVSGGTIGPAGGVLSGTYPNPTFAVDMATQAELDVVAGAVVTVASNLSAHLADAADAHDASAISVLDAAGNFAATDVEAALAELQDSIDAPFADGDVTLVIDGTFDFSLVDADP